MAKTLLEAFAKPVAIAENYYKSRHNGEAMDSTRKLVLVSSLHNVNKFLHESIAVGQATQKSGMAYDANDTSGLGAGSFEKFTMNLVNAAIPNLIAFDLVIVAPMKDWTGSVTYVEYLAGTDKAPTAAGDVLNSVFGFDPQNKINKYYTSNVIVDPVVGTFVSGTTTVSFAKEKVIDGSVKLLNEDGENIADTASVDPDTGVITATLISGAVAADVKKVVYEYDNIVVPQKGEELPTLTMRIQRIPLIAKARRIVINYAQIAQFQAQTEYGLDINKALAEQATAELQYEIDTEIVEMLRDAVKGNAAQTLDSFPLTTPVGVSKQEHYASFVEWIEKADQIVYTITKKFTCTYMVAGAGIKKVLRFCPEWKAATGSVGVGPYFAGTLGNIKVFITPSFEEDEFIFGVNGGDLMTSAGVYAPYLAVVPTQLLQMPDGLTTQGFSTVYDAKILNSNLLVYGRIQA